MLSPKITLRRLLAALFLASGLFVDSANAVEEDLTDARVIERLQDALVKSEVVTGHPDLKVVREPAGQQLQIFYRTKKWLVYNRNMAGDFAEEPGEEVGPKSEGFIVTVWLVADQGCKMEQWAGRDSKLDLPAALRRDDGGAAMSVLRYPYWSVYGGRLVFEGGKRVANVNIAFGSKPERELLRRVVDELRRKLGVLE